MADESPKKWDLKQLGVGGGSVLAVLFLFQEKGMDFISQNQIARDQVIIERTKANSERIENLESTVADLEDKLDNGFESLRIQIREEIKQLSEIIRISDSDRFTKSQQDFYAKSIEERLLRHESQIKDLRESIKK